ncbi:MAG: 1-deoxy-D-xylulose-5-phosphate synthase [Evtepia sp.]|uniref:1-deoxy-D-xylulose-5-phosphate synthase n=1 Tax=Evtepia sp. TaxID=2773933 RepID=UPI002A754C71|nr:1-deoxy-D-xylulose-5-phosphate synthase [Evtepia sp.]MDY3013826.1 1-deoxy-D-xylulose-5-phosphate synthase [Evtepia sp.]
MSERKEFPSLGKISDREAEELCQELRERVLDVVSQTGGHLASNLGIVELTVALHRVYDTGKDRLVFDVGHQCYVHKILTGRNGRMETLRAFGGIAGFPKPAESRHDACIAGHASTAVSTALGMAEARTRLGEDYRVVALLGDGSLTGGLAYEGLSMAGQSGEPLVVILNDNGMSIDASMGGIAQHLARQRLKPQYLRAKGVYRKIMNATPPGRGLYRFIHKVKEGVKASLLPCSMFENMGFRYMGPVDGHDVKGLTRLLAFAATVKGPVLLHVKTVKGKGYPLAEKTPDAFHGIGPFYRDTGALRYPGKEETFSARFGKELCVLAREDKRICGITAAMTSGTGLAKFAEEFPQRFFDVGIAEAHAVSMAAGLAKQGMIPVFAVYSTFLQRSYDMLIHDVAIDRLHVVFCVDRAGLVGDDGETHQGLFDPAFLKTVPGMTVLCPASLDELSVMMRRAIYEISGPVAVRYPRGGENHYNEEHGNSSACVLRQGRDLTMVTFGTLTGNVLLAADRLRKDGISAEVIKLNQIVPLPTEQVLDSLRKTGRLLVAQECVSMGAPGEGLLAAAALEGIQLKASAVCSCGERFVPHGTIPQLRSLCGLDAVSLYEKAREVAVYGK